MAAAFCRAPAENGADLDIVSIFEAVGQFQAGKLDENGVHKIEMRIVSGRGFLRRYVHGEYDEFRNRSDGLSLPYGASNPAVQRRTRNANRSWPAKRW